MNIKQQPKNISNLYQNSSLAFITEITILLSAGLLTALLHNSLKIPLQLPGKQGIIFMLIVATVSSYSDRRFAASITTIGAALYWYLLPGILPDPYKPLLILFAGFIFDLILFNAKYSAISIWFFALAGSLAWAIIPISRIVISLLTQLPYNSFKFGTFYPIFTHFIFGFAGTLIAGLIIKSNQKTRN